MYYPRTFFFIVELWSRSSVVQRQLLVRALALPFLYFIFQYAAVFVCYTRREISIKITELNQSQSRKREKTTFFRLKTRTQNKRRKMEYKSFPLTLRYWRMTTNKIKSLLRSLRRNEKIAVFFLCTKEQTHCTLSQRSGWP